jgi:hypothetical protein
MKNINITIIVLQKSKILKHKNIPLGNLKKCTNQSQNVRKIGESRRKKLYPTVCT